MSSITGTTGQDVYKKVCLDAEQRVEDAVRRLQELSGELTQKAEEQPLPKLHLPRSEKQLQQLMGMADIYEETLRMLPDDTKVTVAYQHPAYRQDTDMLNTSTVTVEKRCLMWTESILMITRVKGDMGMFKKDFYGTEEAPIDVNDEMPTAYTTLVPIRNITSIDVAWETNPDDWKVASDAASESTKQADSEPVFDQLNLDESELEPLFSDFDNQQAHSTKMCDDFNPAHHDEPLQFEARGAISSYDKSGKFENCFHLRSMDWLHSKETFKCPPVKTGYRFQLEHAFKKHKKVVMTGTLSNAVTYDNCIRLVMSDITITRGAGGHMAHMCLFVSRDYKVPPVGSEIATEGFVYAYSPSNTNGERRQLALNATTVKTIHEGR